MVKMTFFMLFNHHSDHEAPLTKGGTLTPYGIVSLFKQLSVFTRQNHFSIFITSPFIFTGMNGPNGTITTAGSDRVALLVEQDTSLWCSNAAKAMLTSPLNPKASSC